MDIGEEDLSMDKESFGIKTMYYNMKENGNAVSLMAWEEYIINGVS